MDNNTTKFQRSEKFLYSSLGASAIISDVEKGDFFGINKVGVEIWNLLTTPITVIEIVRGLQKKFKVSDEQCKKEVKAFLTEMLKEEAIIEIQ